MIEGGAPRSFRSDEGLAEIFRGVAALFVLSRKYIGLSASGERLVTAGRRKLRMPLSISLHSKRSNRLTEQKTTEKQARATQARPHLDAHGQPFFN
jgi:hypothetical protein